MLKSHRNDPANDNLLFLHIFKIIIQYEKFELFEM